MKKLLAVMCVSINAVGLFVGLVTGNAVIFYWGLVFWGLSAWDILKEENNAIHKSK